MTTRLGYHPALDGIRAISILAVMLYHSGLIHGGFLGVDVFFTLSGFLITTLLIEEHAAGGRIVLRDFYCRRALRLLPALVPVVIVSGVAMIATAGPARVGGMSLFVLAVIFYVANWAAIAGLPQGMLGHAWSLSIEEQFYLVWPPVLALLLCRVRARWLLATGLLLAALGSILLRYHLAVSGATGRRFYLGTDAHADPILIGCATACLVSWGYIRGSSPSASTRWRWQAAALAAAAVLVAVLVMARLPDDYARRGASTIVAVAAGILIVDVLRPGSRLAPLLAWSPLVWIGKRSYALYLWHLPVFFLAGALWASGLLEYLPSRIVPAWAITFAMAAASYRWIEAPALRLKSRFEARPADRTRAAPSAPFESSAPAI
jgi:peptidoglycan/LPS O-acetylase OafA/YrhL